MPPRRPARRPPPERARTGRTPPAGRPATTRDPGPASSARCRPPASETGSDHRPSRSTRVSGRRVLRVPVTGADGVPLLGPLREALSGAGPALAPHAADRSPDPLAAAPLAADEDADDDPVAAVVSTTGSTGRAKHVLLPGLGAAGVGRSHARRPRRRRVVAAARPGPHRRGGPGAGALPRRGHPSGGPRPGRRLLPRQAFFSATERLVGRAPGAALHLAGAGAASTCCWTPCSRNGRRARPGRHGGPSRDRPVVTPSWGPCVPTPSSSAGRPCLPALRDRAGRAGVRVISTYGMTETCGGCVYDGVPLPGVQVRVDPPAGGAGPGRVVLGGPVVARGYRSPRPTGAPDGEGFVASRPTDAGSARPTAVCSRTGCCAWPGAPTTWSSPGG